VREQTAKPEAFKETIGTSVTAHERERRSLPLERGCKGGHAELRNDLPSRPGIPGLKARHRRCFSLME
jgi:hypothetical protein